MKIFHFVIFLFYGYKLHIYKMIAIRHKVAIVLLFVSLVGVLTVSYYQILDMDRILVQEGECNQECTIKIGNRCLVCRESTNSDLIGLVKRSTDQYQHNQQHQHNNNNNNQQIHKHDLQQAISSDQYEKRPNTYGSKNIKQNTEKYVNNPSSPDISQCSFLTICLHDCPNQGIVNVCQQESSKNQRSIETETVLNTDEEPLCEEEIPLVMGHAGGDVVNGCENTFQATKFGLEEGMEAVHIDISISKDRVPFLWRDHDPRSLSSRLRQLGIYGTMGCKPAMVPETLKPAHSLDWKTIQSSWYYLNTTSELPADHVISFKEWLEELRPYARNIASIWLEFRMPRELLLACIKEVWREAIAANIQDKLFFKIKSNGQISFHHPITIVGGVDISIDQLSTKQWNTLVYILEEVQTADPQDSVFILNREDEVVYALLVEKVTSKPSHLTEEIKSLVDTGHLNLNGINFEVKTMQDLVENVGNVVASRNNVTRDSCQPQYTQVAAWTVNNMEISRELVCLKIDYIITDYPGRIERNVDCSKHHEKTEYPEDSIPECPMFCARIYDPVCGSDGKTHSNECMLSLAACESSYPIQLLYQGKCQDKPEYFYSSDEMERSTGVIEILETENQVYTNPNSNTALEEEKYKSKDNSIPEEGHIENMNEPYEDDLNALLQLLDTSLLCDASYCKADQAYDPVCGKDGLTYDNACLLAQTRCSGNAVELYKSGTCDPDVCQNACSRQTNPVCGTDRRSYSNLCNLDKAAYCNKHQHELRVWHRGRCGECRRMCTREFAPVCGSDGNVYATQCQMEAESCKKGTPVWKISDGLCLKTGEDKQNIKIIFDNSLHSTINNIIT